MPSAKAKRPKKSLAPVFRSPPAGPIETQVEWQIVIGQSGVVHNVYEQGGSFWFRTEDESSEGPFATADEADDAFRAYCKDLGL